MPAHRMPAYRPALGRAGATLTAAALTLATCLPSEAATSTGWRVVFRDQLATGGSALNGVAAPSPDSAWAVGGGGPIGSNQTSPVAAQWNGTAWQPVTLPSGLAGTLGPISAPAANDVWTASILNGYVLHWDGTAWSVARTWKESTGMPKGLTGITAFSPSDVWVFGAPGAYPGLGTWHLSGGTWHKVTGLGAGIDRASALSPTSMWAIGSDSRRSDDIIVRYTGTTWQQVSSPVLSGRQFNDILALSASNIWVTASAPQHLTTVLLHFNGQQWSSVPVTVPKGVNQLYAIAADGHGGLWIAAPSLTRSAWVLHRSAAGTWSSRRLVTTPLGGVLDVAHIPGTTSLWATGSLGRGTTTDSVVWGRGPAS